MNPKFQVGEPVYLVTKHYGYQWIKAEVQRRKFSKRTFSLTQREEIGPAWSYWLGPELDINDVPWSEAALRKVNPDTLEKCEEGWSVEKLKKETSRKLYNCRSIIFPGGRGTANMALLAERHGLVIFDLRGV